MKALALLVFSICVTALFAQNSQTAIASAPPATPLESLIHEAEAKNPEIRVARHAYRAAVHGSKAAGTLPDTQLTVQNLAVGSPRPLAGYTNSDFAYVGLGASQELPWPGKRQLRTQVAGLQAQSMLDQSKAVDLNILEQLKIAYYWLSYLQQDFSILTRDDKVLSDMEQIAESQYRVGKGNQQEVLKAQLQHTQILEAMSRNRSEQAVQQTELKRLLNRSQDSPDVVALPLTESALPPNPDGLFRTAAEQNPDIAARKASLEGAKKAVELAHKEFRPDFGMQYMYQNTDRRFRDYYMATFTVDLPNRGRRRAELAQALEQQKSADAALDAETQARMAGVRQQYDIARLSSEQLKIYREGLLPQAQATFRAAMAAYQANRQDFETLLSSFRDVLNVEEQYQLQLSEHETALARLESLTGETLP